MVKNVSGPIVMKLKFGMESNVSAEQDFISMEKLVSNASMVKYGLQDNKIVHVLKDLNGMECFVRNSSFVLEEEFGMKHISNVFVLIIPIGQEISVRDRKSVVVGKFMIGIEIYVYVLVRVNGMVIHV